MDKVEPIGIRLWFNFNFIVFKTSKRTLRIFGCCFRVTGEPSRRSQTYESSLWWEELRQKDFQFISWATLEPSAPVLSSGSSGLSLRDGHEEGAGSRAAASPHGHGPVQEVWASGEDSSWALSSEGHWARRDPEVDPETAAGIIIWLSWDWLRSSWTASQRTGTFWAARLA